MCFKHLKFNNVFTSLKITWPMVDACCLDVTLRRSNLTPETAYNYFLTFVVLYRTVI